MRGHFGGFGGGHHFMGGHHSMTRDLGGRHLIEGTSRGDRRVNGSSTNGRQGNRHPRTVTNDNVTVFETPGAFDMGNGLGLELLASTEIAMLRSTVLVGMPNNNGGRYGYGAKRTVHVAQETHQTVRQQHKNVENNYPEPPPEVVRHPTPNKYSYTTTPTAPPKNKQSANSMDIPLDRPPPYNECCPQPPPYEMVARASTTPSSVSQPNTGAM